MKCILIGHVIDVSPKTFKSKEKDIDLNIITCLDPDAYREEDRYMPIYSSNKIELPKNMLQKDYMFEGIFTKEFGKHKFKLTITPSPYNEDDLK